MKTNHSVFRIALLGATIGALTLWLALEPGDKKDSSNRHAREQTETTGSQKGPDPQTVSTTGSSNKIYLSAPIQYRSPAAEIYAAASLRDLERLSPEVRAPQNFDYATVQRQADAICNGLPSLAAKGRGSYAELLKEWKGPANVGPEALASAGVVDAFRSRYCSFGLDQPSRYADVLEAEALELEAAGYKALSDALHLEDGSPEHVARVQEALVDFLAKTQSPSAFRLGARTLADGSTIGKHWVPPAARHLETAFLDDASRQWRAVGVDLAFCSLAAPACAPNSLTTVQSCMPANCRPGESLQAFYSRTQSPAAIAAAQAYASALLALRGGG